MFTHAQKNDDKQDWPDECLTLADALKASRFSFIAIGGFSFFINLLMLTGPLFMLQIYDRVLSSRSIPTLVALSILVAGLFAILGVLEFIRTRILTRIGANIDLRIAQRTFDASMRLSLSTGGHINSSTPLRELEVARQFLSGPAIPALFDAPWVPIYLGVIFLFHWYLGVLATIAAVILFVLAWINDFRSKKPAADISAASAKANQVADNGRRNAEVISAMAMLNPIRKLWEKDHLDAVVHETTARDRGGSISAISKSLRLFFQSAMLAAGAALVIFDQVTPGVMIAASIILGRALQPVEQAITHWRGLVQYNQAKKRLDQTLEKMPAKQQRMSLPKPKGKILVRGLQIMAPGNRKVILNNVNFVLEPGSALGLVGMSASGKSTLSRALVGAWPYSAGEIRIDGATYDQWDPDQLGRYIGYLPQDVELFGGTLKENISRFDTDPDENAIINAAKDAGIDELVKKLGGYDTDIGHLGTNLSVGQRQRVALARALYGDPSLIVLDEPNSNLDMAGDQALNVAIAGIKERGQTLIIVSHKMSVLNAVDFILELNEGKQQAFGPRDEVLAHIRKRETERRNKPNPPA